MAQNVAIENVNNQVANIVMGANMQKNCCNHSKTGVRMKP